MLVTSAASLGMLDIHSREREGMGFRMHNCLGILVSEPTTNNPIDKNNTWPTVLGINGGRLSMSLGLLT